jgi:hypothetical protein
MASPPDDLLVKGRAEDQPMPSWRRALASLTGLSLLLGLGALFARFVLGRRREASARVEGGRLLLEEELRMGGRQLQHARQTFSHAQVASARLETRYPALPLLLGMLGLGLGVIFGLIWLLDGVQGEFTPWILAGVGALMGGVALDLALTTLASSMPGTATLVLYLPGGRVLRLIGCDPAQAEALVQWLHGDHR